MPWLEVSGNRVGPGARGVVPVAAKGVAQGQQRRMNVRLADFDAGHEAENWGLIGALRASSRMRGDADGRKGSGTLSAEQTEAAAVRLKTPGACAARSAVEPTHASVTFLMRTTSYALADRFTGKIMVFMVILGHHQTTPPLLRWRSLRRGLAVTVTSLAASEAGPRTLAYGIGDAAD